MVDEEVNEKSYQLPLISLIFSIIPYIAYFLLSLDDGFLRVIENLVGDSEILKNLIGQGILWAFFLALISPLVSTVLSIVSLFKFNKYSRTWKILAIIALLLALMALLFEISGLSSFNRYGGIWS